MAEAQLASSWSGSALRRWASRLVESTGVLQRAGWDRELDGRIGPSGTGRGPSLWTWRAVGAPAGNTCSCSGGDAQALCKHPAIAVFDMSQLSQEEAGDKD